MKRRFAIFNGLLAVAVLFSMLFQSLHTVEHFSEQLSQKRCHHDYRSAHEITHQHHNYDHCLVCDFTFSSFISTETFAFTPHFTQFTIPYLSALDNVAVAVSQNTPPLRGPPAFIV